MPVGALLSFFDVVFPNEIFCMLVGFDNGVYEKMNGRVQYGKGPSRTTVYRF
jgi:hypothetical protein